MRTVKHNLWVYPFIILAATALLIFFSSSLIDFLLLNRPSKFWDITFSTDPEAVYRMVNNIAGIAAGVLGTAVPIVLIIVQLAATRYTSEINHIFFKIPINFIVLGSFVITCIHSLWISIFFDKNIIPVFNIIVNVVLLSVNILILVPYFFYVFRFLHPDNIIENVKSRVNRKIFSAKNRKNTLVIKEKVIDAVEELADIALNSVERIERYIAIKSVNALTDIVTKYIQMKPYLSDEWFELNLDFTTNPDFISLPIESIKEITRKKIWFELKVLRQFQMIYNHSLNELREINYMIARGTRVIGHRASSLGDIALLETSIKYFNTYMRATINTKDVRTAYNVLNQYRLLAERLITPDKVDQLISICNYFKYYAQVSEESGLVFIMETVAHDLEIINELVHKAKLDKKDLILDIFLNINQLHDCNNKMSPRGVIKAKMRLAAFYFVNNDKESASRIYQNILSESKERLISIKDELLSLETLEFWEENDRGTNFDYLEPELKKALKDLLCF